MRHEHDTQAAGGTRPGRSAGRTEGTRAWRIVAAVLLALTVASPVGAEEPVPGTPVAADGEASKRKEDGKPNAAKPAGVPFPEGAVLARIRGNDVNVRVGPRRDNHPVTQLSKGDVVVVIERIGDWVGVRVPAGLPAALSGKHAVRVGEDGVRVTTRTLNLRVMPPEKDRPMPGAFRDKVRSGQVLPFVREEDGWYWIVAPESVRAYVFAKYVEELGAPDAHGALLEKARASRRELIESMVASRKRLRVLKASRALREAIGEAQQALYRVRLAGGYDRVPVAQAANQLLKAYDAHPLAGPEPKKLARTLLADFESELKIRVARRDAEVARLRGLPTEAEKPLTPTRDGVDVTGIIRWEAAPRWKDGGAFILWVDGEPAYVLRLTTGTEGPLPDLKRSCDGKPRRIHGRQPGTRVFGLPALDVLKLTTPP